MAKDKGKSKGEAPQDNGPPVPPRLRDKFNDEVSKKVADKFSLKNPMSRPAIEKIIVNVNVGRHLDGTKLPQNVRDTVLDSLNKITGQKPIQINAKKSVSNFKVREGMPSSMMVTMRRERMWYFLDRFINLATPRIRDFRGLSDKSFDSSGNYSMGLTEQGVFPEIDMAHVNFTHGMNINIVFSNSNPQVSKFVLEELGFPFRKPENKN